VIDLGEDIQSVIRFWQSGVWGAPPVILLDYNNFHYELSVLIERYPSLQINLSANGANQKVAVEVLSLLEMPRIYNLPSDILARVPHQCHSDWIIPAHL
jgi:hypothetical protein